MLSIIVVDNSNSEAVCEIATIEAALKNSLAMK